MAKKTMSGRPGFHLRDADDALRPFSLLVGFAASDWLFSQLKTSLEPLGLKVCRPDRHVYVYLFSPYLCLG